MRNVGGRDVPDSEINREIMGRVQSTDGVGRRRARGLGGVIAANGAGGETAVPAGWVSAGAAPRRDLD